MWKAMASSVWTTVTNACFAERRAAMLRDKAE